MRKARKEKENMARPEPGKSERESEEREDIIGK